MLGKNRVPKGAKVDTVQTGASPKKASTSDSDEGVDAGAYKEARWNVIPQLRRGVNRGYGAIRRTQSRRLEHQSSVQHSDPPSRNVMRRSASADHDPMEAEDEGEGGIEVEVLPVRNNQPVYRSSVSLEIKDSEQPLAAAKQVQPSQSGQVDPPHLGQSAQPAQSAHSAQPAHSAHSAQPAHSAQSAQPAQPAQSAQPAQPAQSPQDAESAPLAHSAQPGQQVQPARLARPPVINQLPSGPRLQAFAVNTTAKSRQMETRQRQLEVLRRMEERYKSMAENRTEKATQPEEVSPKIASPTAEPTTCACQRLTIHVLDISQAISNQVVTWHPVRPNSSRNAPEETILYTLTLGHGELIMFGGIQKDVSAMASAGTSQDGDTVSNALYFLTPPSTVI